ncbi:MAG: class I SAM-dependent methyltransferase [Thermomicrobiales bacterium]
MAIAGLSLTEHLPCPTGETALLLLGGDNILASALRRAGYRIDRHALDTGPLAQLAGIPFTPPVTAWPFPDASYDAVVLLDELALTVREEEALAEAGRVLRPGGILLLRVPASGRLAWLDGYNVYRYVREISRRGRLLPEIQGVGWRRHYRRQDVRGLLRPHFRVREIRAAGLGLSDTARLGLLLFWRWALRSERGDSAIREIPRVLARHEGGWAFRGYGYWLVVAAECRAEA